MPKAEHNTCNYKNVRHRDIKKYEKQHQSTLVKKKTRGWTLDIRKRKKPSS